MRRDTTPPIRGWRTAHEPWVTYPDNRNGSNGVTPHPASAFIETGLFPKSPFANPSREILSAVAATIYGWGGASRVGPTTALPMGCRLRASLPLRHFPGRGR